MKMIDHNHFICHLILGTFTEYPQLSKEGNIILVLPHSLFITNRNFLHQSISFNPLFRKYSFALLKCLQPKKP